MYPGPQRAPTDTWSALSFQAGVCDHTHTDQWKLQMPMAAAFTRRKAKAFSYFSSSNGCGMKGAAYARSRYEPTLINGQTSWQTSLIGRHRDGAFQLRDDALRASQATDWKPSTNLRLTSFFFILRCIRRQTHWSRLTKSSYIQRTTVTWFVPLDHVPSRGLCHLRSRG